ncbi:MBL fold metallo-hydrolase [Pseudidiomarina aestuarii]|uniref:MBL fold metallo-hydrolase n=1 Tax=Pseudidiomarina aestuarii TaxID=624146 RepID=UPI003A97D4C5
MQNIQKWLRSTLVTAAALVTLTVSAQPTMDDVEIKATQVSERVFMLTGAGGNIGVYVGDNGVAMVDAQYAALTDKIATAISEISDKPLQLLVNTHYHRDHVDGNAGFVERGAKVVAHENVLSRLQADAEFNTTGLPTITFDNELVLKIGGDSQLFMRHYATGHTDGDAVIWFGDENVIHAGDMFFVDRFPFIDLNSGGNVQGFIDNVSAVIAELDDETKIIPGHGPLSTKQDWQRLVSMVIITREEVRMMQTEGLSADEIVERGLSDQWDSWTWGFITEERWIRTLLQEL